MTDVAIIPRGFAGFVFDAIFSETHYSTLEVTENPVESGASITDHAYVKPYRVTVSAGISNTPLGPVSGQFGDGAERARTAYQALLDLQATREPFDVQTGLKLYSDMVCTSIGTQQDPRTPEVLDFVAELRQIIIVTTEVVTYPARAAGSATNQAGKKNVQGEKQGRVVAKGGPKAADSTENPASKPEAKRSRSVLRSIVDSL